MYVLEISLKINYSQNRFLGKLFVYKWKIKNKIINFANHKLISLFKDTRYKEAIEKYRNSKSKSEKKTSAKILNELIIKFKLDKGSIYKFIKEQSKDFKHYITSQELQSMADDVLTGIENVLYSNGELLHNKSLYDIHSISAKSKDHGIFCEHIKDGYIEHGNKQSKKLIRFDLDIDINNHYQIECLREDIDKIKFARIIRKQFPNYYHYYLQIIIDSIPPNKLKIRDGTSGIDIGTQTVAVVNDTECILTELAPKTDDYNKRIAKLNQKLDRSRQETNPDLYNEDRTVKNGSKGKFKKSNNYIKLQRKLRTIYRKKTAYTRNEHNKLVNKIIENSKQGIFIEPMNFQSLARKSKSKAEKSERTKIIKGKVVRLNKKKKRFGKSINNKSPGLFISILEYKCRFNNIGFFKIDRTSFKASQYNHITNEFKKKDLSERWNYKIDGINDIQRDLYSAFLIKNTNKELIQANRDKCFKEFDNFIKLHNIEIDRIRNSKDKKVSGFGI